MVDGWVRRAILLMTAALMFTPGAIVGVHAQDKTSEDQIALYTQQQEELTQHGREAVEWFVAGNDEAFLQQSSSAIQDALAGVSFETMLNNLETNRVSMDFPAGNSLFRGHFDGSARITGIYHDGASRSFLLTTDEPQSVSGPAGTWTGWLLPGETPISVTFRGSGDGLAASIDIPTQGVVGGALTNVSYASEQPIGEILSAQALPLSPVARRYMEVRAWGSGYIVFTVVFDSTGTIQGFHFTTPWQTPSDSDRSEDEVVTSNLPASEQLFVYWGGQNELPSYHAGAPGWRYGYEFAIWRDGSTYQNDGASNEDYYVWGMPVAAPAAGTVVAVENSVADLMPGQAVTPDLDAVGKAGNYIVIQTADNEWIVLAHLQQGSVSVNVGDTVEVGSAIGLVGRSGSVPEPLLHVHAQSSPSLDAPAGTGLPMVFSSTMVGGTETPQLAAPRRGQFVAPLG